MKRRKQNIEVDNPRGSVSIYTMSTWKYNRMYARQYNTPKVKVEDPTIPSRIDILLANTAINEWERNFLTSIKAGFDKYKSLTEGQNNTFVAIEKRYSPEVLAARTAWQSNWTAEMASDWAAMMEYYSKTPYFRGAVEKFQKNNAYIPSEKEYNDICNNKYSVRYLKNLKIPAKFKQGALVVYKRYGTYRLATVVDIGNVADWTKGSRHYKIMIVGEADLCGAAEKELLYYRDGIIDKLEKPSDEMPF